MISLIICSRTSVIAESLLNNIKKSIGVVYEVITIDNSQQQYSIFEAYNQGVEQSIYPLLCFMHDDISYYTQNWGQNVITHFKDVAVGAIGIAGSPYVTKLPGSWWGGGLVNESIIPANADDNKPRLKEVSIDNNNTSRHEVAVLDGVWFCIRKKLFDTIRFDDINYRGFHNYDTDITMQILQAGYKNYFITNILVKHYSSGNINKDWCESTITFNKKWDKMLPVSIIQLTRPQKHEAELKTFKEYIYNLLYNNYSHTYLYKLITASFFKFRAGYFNYKTPIFFLKVMVIVANYKGIK